MHSDFSLKIKTDLNHSRKNIKVQRIEEFGDWSRMSCAWKAPAAIMQGRGKDGQFQIAGDKATVPEDILAASIGPGQWKSPGSKHGKPSRI